MIPAFAEQLRQFPVGQRPDIRNYRRSGVGLGIIKAYGSRTSESPLRVLRPRQSTRPSVLWDVREGAAGFGEADEGDGRERPSDLGWRNRRGFPAFGVDDEYSPDQPPDCAARSGRAG